MEASPLARLPLKVRVLIYEFALEASTPWPSRALTCFREWHRVGQKPVFYRGLETSLERPHKRPYPGLVYACKAIFQEAWPVFFTVNTFKWLDEQAVQKALGQNFDRIQRVELYTSLAEFRGIILPASCRTVKLHLLRDHNPGRFNGNSGERLLDCIVIPGWADTVKHWRLHGVQQIKISHYYGNLLESSILMRVALKSGVVRSSNNLGARSTDATLQDLLITQHELDVGHENFVRKYRTANITYIPESFTEMYEACIDYSIR